MRSILPTSSPPPVLIEFVDGSRIESHPDLREESEKDPAAFDAKSPKTTIIFSDDRRVALPTDQVVLAETRNGAAQVGLGGMSFEGVEDDQLIFWRVQDLLPEEILSPQRELRVKLDAGVISNVQVNGQRVWPEKQAAR